MNLVAKAEIDGIQRSFRRYENRLTDFTEPLGDFAKYMQMATDKTFNALRRGGSFRGVFWGEFKPQYVRADGTEVPAWGNVPRADGQGLVMGRKRPSGTRLKPGDPIAQDTMNLRAKAATIIALGKDRVVIGPRDIDYAAYQQALRPYLFFENRKDMAVAKRMVYKHLKRKAS